MKTNITVIGLGYTLREAIADARLKCSLLKYGMKFVYESGEVLELYSSGAGKDELDNRVTSIKTNLLLNGYYILLMNMDIEKRIEGKKIRERIEKTSFRSPSDYMSQMYIEAVKSEFKHLAGIKKGRIFVRSFQISEADSNTFNVVAELLIVEQ